MTTVGELKKKLAGLPDTAPIEFWVVFGDRPMQLVFAGEEVRYPAEQVGEIILKEIDG